MDTYCRLLAIKNLITLDTFFFYCNHNYGFNCKEQRGQPTPTTRTHTHLRCVVSARLQIDKVSSPQHRTLVDGVPSDRNSKEGLTILL